MVTNLGEQNIANRAVSTSRHPLLGGQTKLEAFGKPNILRSQCAPDLSAEARHKIFDNDFFLKYIQQLGLRKISHFHSR